MEIRPIGFLLLSILIMGNYFGYGSAEKLAKVIQHNEGWHEGSLTYRNNNPGALFDSKGKFRKFKTYKDGLNALISDLKVKASGKSTSGITPDSSLEEFVGIYVAGGDVRGYEKKYPKEIQHYIDSIRSGK